MNEAHLKCESSSLTIDEFISFKDDFDFESENCEFEL